MDGWTRKSCSADHCPIHRLTGPGKYAPPWSLERGGELRIHALGSLPRPLLAYGDGVAVVSGKEIKCDTRQDPIVAESCSQVTI
jgi:hypothetical protein